VTSYDLDSRIALVTGAAQGLGEGMARAPATAGAKVTVADLQDSGADIATALGDAHGFVRHDVTDDASWERAVAATVEQLGGLDILVNNAGVEITELITELDPDRVRTQLEVNDLGTALGRARTPGDAP
jgi:NAD(P)-dependent dehydrogenase (short-subunit alcohol dehydrogenase family)